MEVGKRLGKLTTSQGKGNSEEEHKLWSLQIWVRISTSLEYQLCLWADKSAFLSPYFLLCKRGIIVPLEVENED